MKIIEIEGITGAGKTTAIPFIAKRLRKNTNLIIKCQKEPGGTALGMELRKILLKRRYEIDSLTQMLLYLANRNDVFSSNKKQYVDVDILLCDRFYGSTFVYQLPEYNLKDGAKFNLSTKSLRQYRVLNALMKNIFNDTLPIFLSVILNVSSKVAFDRIEKRIGKGGKRPGEKIEKAFFIEENNEYLDRYYCYLNMNRDQKIVLNKKQINAEGTVNETVSKTYNAIIDALDKAENEYRIEA